MERRKSYKISGSTESYTVPVLAKEISSILKDISQHLPKSVTVLDIGCGNQPLRKLIEQNNWNYKSLDITQNDFKNVDFIGRIDSDITIDEKFDLLVCTEVLEHVLLWDKAFRNFAVLCKPKSKVLLTAPFFYPLHEEPDDYWRPTLHAFNLFAEGFGFKVIHQKKAGSNWDVLGTLLNSMYITSTAKSFKSKLKGRLFLYILKYLQSQLSSGEIATYFNAEGSWYLSNIVVLERK